MQPPDGSQQAPEHAPAGQVLLLSYTPPHPDGPVMLHEPDDIIQHAPRGQGFGLQLVQFPENVLGATH